VINSEKNEFIMEDLNEENLENAEPKEIYKALFQQWVTGHGQMAMMFLGKLENPHSGLCQKPDLQAAKVFIDQLEMVEVKTQGNLDEEEILLLTRTLSALRSTFAETMDSQE
jgi:hypothetical protein